MDKLKYIKLFENFVLHKTEEPYKTNYSGIKGDDERTIQKGQKVRAFRNLNTTTVKNRWEREDNQGFRDDDDVLWSIRDTKSNKTIHHTYNIWLKDCTFPVLEGTFNDNKGSGRRGVLQTGTKQIHAFVQGNVIAWDSFNYDFINSDDSWIPLYYNPDVVDSFVVAETAQTKEEGIAKMKILSAEEVIMAETTTPSGKKVPLVLAKNPQLEKHIMNNPTKDNWEEFKK